MKKEQLKQIIKEELSQADEQQELLNEIDISQLADPVFFQSAIEILQTLGADLMPALRNLSAKSE